MNAILEIHVLILFIFWDYIWKHFNFVITVFIIFQGYGSSKNYFNLSLNTFIYNYIKQNHESFLFVKVLTKSYCIKKISTHRLILWLYLSF